MRSESSKLVLKSRQSIGTVISVMTTTAVATESTQGLGGRRARLMAGALVAFLSVVIYAVAAPGHARAASGPVSAPVPAIPGVSGASAGAAGADQPAQTSLAPQGEPAPTDQTASTQQAASAAASAAQQQPQNIVISIRINSPGNDGPITQINAAVGAAGSSNNSGTGQNAGSGAGQGQGGSQNASTDQTANSNSAAVQNQPQNSVISIRINSPGNNGAIVQENLTVSISSSGNVSVTSQEQEQPDASAAGGTKSPLAVSPSKHGSRQIKGSGGTSRGKAAPAKTSSAAARPAAGGTPSQPSTHHATASAPAFISVRHAKRTIGTAAHRIVARPLATTAHHLAVAPHNAADALRNLAPRPTIQAGSHEQNVSNAVVLTLVAILGAFAVLVASTLMGRSSRVFGRWNWRLR